MSTFATPDAVYRLIGATMQDVVDAPGFAMRLGQLDLVLQFKISKPTATITAAFPGQGERRLDLGPTRMRPTVTAALDADAAHEFFLGDLNVFLARDQGALVISGGEAAIGRFLGVIPQMRSIVSPLYRARFYGNPGQGINDWARGGPGGLPITVHEGFVGD